jgi:hypothetical protein
MFAAFPKRRRPRNEPIHAALMSDDLTDVAKLWIAPCTDLVIAKFRQWAQEASVEAVRIPSYWPHA